MAAPYKWHPIADLEVDPRKLTEGELVSLRRVWENQKNEMVAENTLEEFNRRLHREWAIETGIIEDVYTLDRGVTRTLIERGIDADLIPRDATNRDTVLVARIIQDHYDTLEGMLDFVGGQRPLSTSYIKELHAALLKNQETHTVVDPSGRRFEQPLERGAYKLLPNNPTRPDGSIHEYCPPEHVASEMDELIRMYRNHHASTPPEVEAAWLHHRFTQIHPFVDGNGRVARALASLVFIKAGWFPLTVKRDDRTRYLDALENADHDDLRPLVALFVEAQRNALIAASEIACDVAPRASVEDAIAAVRNRLVVRGRLPRKEWMAANSVADSLVALAKQRFGRVKQTLDDEIGRGVSFHIAAGNQTQQGGSTASAVQKAGHSADPAEYSQYVRMALNTENLTLYFYAIGPRYRGLIGVVAYLGQQDNVYVLEGGAFLISYEEDAAQVPTRFSTWLERMIILGLNEWRRFL